MNCQHTKAVQTLQTAKGQIEATIRMIDEGRYCVDISNQIMAAQSLLKKANLLILEQHMNSCVKEAFETGNEKEKLDEVMGILSRIAGK